MTVSYIFDLLMLAVVPSVYYRNTYWFKAYNIIFNIYNFIGYILILYAVFTDSIQTLKFDFLPQVIFGDSTSIVRQT